MKLLLSALASLFLVAGTVQAADPVDLRGKKGVVDPNDLKKDDPKPAKSGNGVIDPNDLKKDDPKPPKLEKNPPPKL